MQSRAILEGQQAATTDIALLLGAAGYRLKPDNEAYGGLQYALGTTSGLLKVVSLSRPRHRSRPGWPNGGDDEGQHPAPVGRRHRAAARRAPARAHGRG